MTTSEKRPSTQAPHQWRDESDRYVMYVCTACGRDTENPAGAPQDCPAAPSANGPSSTDTESEDRA